MSLFHNFVGRQKYKPKGHSTISDREVILKKTRARMTKVWQGNQQLGRQGAIGCVSLEITQKCNLDCSLCYLSPNANQITDLPLSELFQRLEKIRHDFGPNTDIQISGGDPTVRSREDLLAIVRYARSLELNPTLMTNGIKCSRDLLEELVDCGLSDVAFHVDMTQERIGYADEEELNDLRLEYIERTKGLPLMVMFNTTIFEQNFHQIPKLVRFFIEQSANISFVSFQLQADTGRSRLNKREATVSLDSVMWQINQGAGSSLFWDVVLVGHPKCNKYAGTLVINGKALGILEDKKVFADFLNEFGHVTHDRRDGPGKIFWHYFKIMAWKPAWIFRALKIYLPRIWSLRSDLIVGRGKINKLSFFIHNFMDADNLDPERIEACSFMVMTSDGPVSMCSHNAARDDYILQPLAIDAETDTSWCEPISI